jgi:hypothetical protein
MTRSKVAAKYVNVADRVQPEDPCSTRVPKGTLILVSTERTGNRAEIIDFCRSMNKR